VRGPGIVFDLTVIEIQPGVNRFGRAKVDVL
jgi:hypothetical protein